MSARSAPVSWRKKKETKYQITLRTYIRCYSHVYRSSNYRTRIKSLKTASTSSTGRETSLARTENTWLFFSPSAVGGIGFTINCPMSVSEFTCLVQQGSISMPQQLAWVWTMSTRYEFSIRIVSSLWKLFVVYLSLLVYMALISSPWSPADPFSVWKVPWWHPVMDYDHLLVH